MLATVNGRDDGVYAVHYFRLTKRNRVNMSSKAGGIWLADVKKTDRMNRTRLCAFRLGPDLLSVAPALHAGTGTQPSRLCGL